ncbi:MAG: pilus assembly protein [Bauldia sp.]
MAAKLFNLARSLHRFAGDRRGNVATIFGIAAIPVMLAAGSGIDFGRAYWVRTNMQDALDASALAISKIAATSTSAQLNAAAVKYFNVNFNEPDAKNVTVSATYSTLPTTVKVTGTADIDTYFLGLAGLPKLSLKTTSTATWGQSRLRVALVLDNTGSMSSSGKITALKTATKNLLNQLKAVAINPEDVYVSIVPFVKDVNVGASNYNKSWIRWDLWDNENGHCSKSSYTTKTSCQSHGKTWTTANHNTWNGCVTDRDQNYDITNDAPVAATPATLYVAEQYGSCPAASVMGLNHDWTAMANMVDTMSPNGNTNQAIGLQLGWQTLTSAPYTIPAMDTSFKYETVIILLTDGLNTENRWTTSQSTIDARQAQTCAAIKAAKITIYTVQVNTGGDPKSNMLEDCATTKSNFFLLTDSSQVITTFEAIGTALSQLRLAQ